MRESTEEKAGKKWGLLLSVKLRVAFVDLVIDHLI